MKPQLQQSPPTPLTNRDIFLQKINHPPILELKNSDSEKIFPVLAVATAGAAGLAIANSRQGKIIVSNFKSSFTEYGLAQIQKTKKFFEFLEEEKNGYWVRKYQAEQEARARAERERELQRQREEQTQSKSFSQKIVPNEKSEALYNAVVGAREAIDDLNSGRNTSESWFKERMEFLAKEARRGGDESLAREIENAGSQAKIGQAANSNSGTGNVVKSYATDDGNNSGDIFSSIIGAYNSIRERVKEIDGKSNFPKKQILPIPLLTIATGAVGTGIAGGAALGAGAILPFAAVGIAIGGGILYLTNPSFAGSVNRFVGDVWSNSNLMNERASYYRDKKYQYPGGIVNEMEQPPSGKGPQIDVEFDQDKENNTTSVKVSILPETTWSEWAATKIASLLGKEISVEAKLPGKTIYNDNKTEIISEPGIGVGILDEGKLTISNKFTIKNGTLISRKNDDEGKYEGGDVEGNTTNKK